MKGLLKLIIIGALGYTLFVYSPQILPQIKPLIDKAPQILARINLPLKFWPQIQQMGEEDTQVLGTEDFNTTISQTQQNLINTGQEKFTEAKESFINSLVDKFYEALIEKLEAERAKTSAE